MVAQWADPQWAQPQWADQYYFVPQKAVPQWADQCILVPQAKATLQQRIDHYLSPLSLHVRLAIPQIDRSRKKTCFYHTKH